MSSSGEMKMSLKLMTYFHQDSAYSSRAPGLPTFSCLRCFRSFNSRYVRLDRTGVLKGFMIFLIATAWLVSWSFAELRRGQSAIMAEVVHRLTRQVRKRPCPPAAGRCTFTRESVERMRKWGIPRTCSLSRTSCRKSVRARIRP